MVDIVQIPVAGEVSAIVYFIVTVSILMVTSTIFAMAYLANKLLSTRTPMAPQSVCSDAKNCPNGENCPINLGHCKLPKPSGNDDKTYLPMLIALAAGKDDAFEKLLSHQIMGNTKTAIKEKVGEIVGKDNKGVLEGYLDDMRSDIINELRDEIKDELKGTIRHEIKEKMLSKYHIKL